MTEVINWNDIEYNMLVDQVLDDGEPREDRTGIGTHAIFGSKLEFNLKDGFPMLTTKKVHFKSIVTELLWFIRGETNIAFLKEHGCSIWDEWADENGDLGPVYGKQWRSFPKPPKERFWLEVTQEETIRHHGWEEQPPVDQLVDVIEGLRTNPTSRRHLVVAWNPGQLDQMALPPCHVLFQFYLNNGNELSCQIYQRSVDVGLGLPFNIASYALLTHLVAKEIGAGVDKLIHIGGDVHIYDNHREALMGQIERTSFPAPTLRINSSSMFTALPNEIVLENYEAHAKVPMDVAV